jgi:N-acetylmuramoyl-L-alanine amidase
MLESAIICLALNIVHEARGEPVLGQLAVSKVVLTRAKNDLSKVCQVVFKPYQFSWTITMTGLPDSMEFERALKIAALAVRMDDFTGGATHYHADHIRPTWSRKMKRTVKIGRHIFYKGK